MENHERKTRNGKSGSGKTKLTELFIVLTCVWAETMLYLWHGERSVPADVHRECSVNAGIIADSVPFVLYLGDKFLKLRNAGISDSADVVQRLEESLRFASTKGVQKQKNANDATLLFAGCLASRRRW